MVDWALSLEVMAWTVTWLVEAADSDTVKVALQVPLMHSFTVTLLTRSEGRVGATVSVMWPMAAQRSPKHWLVAAASTWLSKVWVRSLSRESGQTVAVVVMVVTPAGKVRGRAVTER